MSIADTARRRLALPCIAPMNAVPMTSTWSARRLADTPHRLLFFVGASNVLLAMLWWAATMIMTRQLVRQQAGEPPHPRWGTERTRPQPPEEDPQAA